MRSGGVAGMQRNSMDSQAHRGGNLLLGGVGLAQTVARIGLHSLALNPKSRSQFSSSPHLDVLPPEKRDETDLFGRIL